MTHSQHSGYTYRNKPERLPSIDNPNKFCRVAAAAEGVVAVVAEGCGQGLRDEELSSRMRAKGGAEGGIRWSSAEMLRQEMQAEGDS